jgi:hypothetical protein
VISDVQLDGRAGSQVAWAPGAVPLLAVEVRRPGSECTSVCVLHPGCPEVRKRQRASNLQVVNPSRAYCSGKTRMACQLGGTLCRSTLFCTCLGLPRWLQRQPRPVAQPPRS